MPGIYKMDNRYKERTNSKSTDGDLSMGTMHSPHSSPPFPEMTLQLVSGSCDGVETLKRR